MSGLELPAPSTLSLLELNAKAAHTLAGGCIKELALSHFAITKPVVRRSTPDPFRKVKTRPSSAPLGP